jgi:hypothetical protein
MPACSSTTAAAPEQPIKRLGLIRLSKGGSFKKGEIF